MVQVKPVKKTLGMLLAMLLLMMALAVPAMADASKPYVLWNVDDNKESHASEFIIGNAEFTGPDANGKYTAVLKLSREYSVPGFTITYNYLKYNGVAVAQSNTATESTFTISGLPNESSDIPIKLYITVKDALFGFTIHEGEYNLEVRF